MTATVLFSIAAALIGLALLVWAVEPRFFLFVYEKLFFSVDRSRAFIEDLDACFPGRRHVERHLGVLTEEARRLLERPRPIPKAHEMDEYNAPISKAEGPSWRTYYLKVYTGWFPAHCNECPKTYEVFQDMPEVVSIMFSVMEPGNVIPKHHGELLGILRYQLPLIVPAGGECFIEVAGQRHDYRVGRSIMFDDVQEHTVSNSTDGYRVILFLDIQKRCSPPVQAVDNFLMRLITLSPRFKRIAEAL